MLKKSILIIFVSFLLISCTNNTSNRNIQSDSELDYEILGLEDTFYVNEEYELNFNVFNSYYFPNVDQINAKMIFRGFDENILNLDREKIFEISAPQDESDYTENYFDIGFSTSLIEGVDESKQILRTDLLADMYTEFSVPLCLVGIDMRRDEAECSFSLPELNHDFPIELIDVKYSFSPSTQTIILYFISDNNYDYFDISLFDDFSSSDRSSHPRIKYSVENTYSGDLEDSFRIDDNNIGRLVFSIDRSEISGSFDSNFNIGLNYGLINSKTFELNIKEN